MRIAIVLGGLLLSSSAWAIPQARTCRAGGHSQTYLVPGPEMCLLLQDPWQDCNEDPWQLSTLVRTEDTFSDPWQDSADPWQPFAALPAALAEDESSLDPWQPIVSPLAPAHAATLELAADPWQDGYDDPWQVQ